MNLVAFVGLFSYSLTCESGIGRLWTLVLASLGTGGPETLDGTERRHGRESKCVQVHRGAVNYAQRVKNAAAYQRGPTHFPNSLSPVSPE